VHGSGHRRWGGALDSLPGDTLASFLGARSCLHDWSCARRIIISGYVQFLSFLALTRWFKSSEAVLQSNSVVTRKANQALKQRTCLQCNPTFAGNDAFKKMDYPEAIRHYTEALKRNPNDHRVSFLKSLFDTQIAHTVTTGLKTGWQMDKAC
jgi:hypothetical protein